MWEKDGKLRKVGKSKKKKTKSYNIEEKRERSEIFEKKMGKLIQLTIQEKLKLLLEHQNELDVSWQPIV